MTHVSPYAPNYEGRVPVDTGPGNVPVYRALKNPHVRALQLQDQRSFLHSEPYGTC